MSNHFLDKLLYPSYTRDIWLCSGELWLLDFKLNNAVQYDYNILVRQSQSCFYKIESSKPEENMETFCPSLRDQDFWGTTHIHPHATSSILKGLFYKI